VLAIVSHACSSADRSLREHQSAKVFDWLIPVRLDQMPGNASRAPVLKQS